MIEKEQKIRSAAIARISRLFSCREDSLRVQDRFGSELKPTFVSDFEYNELDQILHDIREVSDKSILEELNAGRLEIRTIEDYCAHMIRCHETKPRDVEAILGDSL